MKSQVHINLFSCFLSRICFKILSTSSFFLFTFLVKRLSDAKRKYNKSLKGKMPPYCVANDGEDDRRKRESTREKFTPNKPNYIVESSEQITHENICSVSWGCLKALTATWRKPHRQLTQRADIFYHNPLTKQICFMSDEWYRRQIVFRWTIKKCFALCVPRSLSNKPNLFFYLDFIDKINPKNFFSFFCGLQIEEKFCLFNSVEYFMRYRKEV